MSAPDYHGVKPVTDDDKDMAEKHLKLTRKLIDDKKELLQDKIDDHKKALIDRVKEGNKRSANYNKSHIQGHEKDLDDADDDEDKIRTSLKTLGTLKTHSRKTYNDVRNSAVKLMYRKAHPDGSS
jgi:hypothetical protein